jgi:hypothetical protein
MDENQKIDCEDVYFYPKNGPFAGLWLEWDAKK